MPDHVVKRGLDIPIKGQATGEAISLEQPHTVAYAPQEFRGVTPKVALKVGEPIREGQVLFFDKTCPEMVFRSPASGTLKAIQRGARRVIVDVVVEVGEGEPETFATHTQSDLDALDAEAARALVLSSGMWGAMKTRPLDNVPRPDVTPQAIVICGSETGPLQPGAEALLGAADQAALQAAVTLLGKLTDGSVYLTHRTGALPPAMNGLSGAELHGFSGPHPSGDPGLQVNLLTPPRGTGQVWTLRAWDAVCLGRFALEGRFETERVYAAVGTGCTTPRLVKTVLGAPMKHIVGDAAAGANRWIRGSVLTGEAVDADRWAGFTTRAVHVLPDDVPRFLFGWAMPMLGAWSFHKAFLSGFTGAGAKQFDLRPGLWGGERAIVPVGYYADVVATPDIVPDFLFKSIIAGDLEESIQLGLLDITMEEAALCTFICPSKVEFDVILRDGLALYEKEA